MQKILSIVIQQVERIFLQIDLKVNFFLATMNHHWPPLSINPSHTQFFYFIPNLTSPPNFLTSPKKTKERKIKYKTMREKNQQILEFTANLSHLLSLMLMIQHRQHKNQSQNLGCVISVLNNFVSLSTNDQSHVHPTYFYYFRLFRGGKFWFMLTH